MDAEQSTLRAVGDTVEAGLLTLVAQGTDPMFDSRADAPRPGLVLEDVITLHMMEVPTEEGASASGPKVAAVRKLLAASAPAEMELPEGAAALSAALYVTVDEARGRVRLHPSAALQRLCTPSPTKPTSRDMVCAPRLLMRRPAVCAARRCCRDGAGAATFSVSVEKRARTGWLRGGGARGRSFQRRA